MTEKLPIQSFPPDKHLVPEVSDEHIDLIGRATMLWSKLESAMEYTIWMFLNLDEQDGKLATKRLNADGKIQTLRRLGERHINEKKLADQFTEYMKHIGELLECRNNIVHGVWGTVMPDNVPIATWISPRADYDVISETFSKDRMESIIDDIRHMIQYFAELPELLGRPRQAPPE